MGNYGNVSVVLVYMFALLLCVFRMAGNPLFDHRFLPFPYFLKIEYLFVVRRLSGDERNIQYTLCVEGANSNSAVDLGSQMVLFHPGILLNTNITG